MTTDQKTLELFVKVFWCFYQNNERAALVLLNKERKERDYGWDFYPGLGLKKPSKTSRKKHHPTVASVSTAEASKNDDIDIPSVDANADTSSIYQSSVFDEISDEEKGDIPILSDTAAVTSLISSLGQSAEVVKDGPALDGQEIITEAQSEHGLRGRKRRATAGENSSGRSSPTDIPNEEVTAANTAKDSRLSSPLLSGSSVSNTRVQADAMVTTNPQSSSAPTTRSQTCAPNPSELPGSLRTNKPEQIPPLKSKKSTRPAPRKKSRPTDDAASDSDYARTSKAPPPHMRRRNTRSMSMKEIKVKQENASESTKLHIAEATDKNSYRRSTRLGKEDSTSSGRLDEAGSKRSSARSGRPPKAVAALNPITSKPVRPSMRTMKLPTRPQKRRRTSADDELHVAMDALTQSTKDSTTSQHSLPTTELQLHSVDKNVAGLSSNEFTPAQDHGGNREGSQSGVRTNEVLSRPREPSETSAVPPAVLGKRKEQTDDSQNRPPPTLSEAAQSELRDIALRPVAKLPADRGSQREMTPLPIQAVSSGHQLRDSALKHADDAIRDAASHALYFLNDPAKPLADWTNDENMDDQDLNVVHQPHFEHDHDNEEIVSSEIVTIRDHEPDPRPKFPTNPPIWAQVGFQSGSVVNFRRTYVVLVSSGSMRVFRLVPQLPRVILNRLFGIYVTYELAVVAFILRTT